MARLEIEAAQDEVRGEPHVLVFRKTNEFQLPPTLTAFVLSDLIENSRSGYAGTMSSILREALGKDQYARLRKLHPSDVEAEALLKGVLGLYGLVWGESSASRGSSKTGGSRSRRTSPTSTESS